MRTLRQHFVPACLLLAGLAPLPAAAAGTTTGYAVLSRMQIGGEGGWDYLAFDGAARRLYISRGDRVVAVDVDGQTQAGVIPDTTGVHGIAVANDLGQGFSSNGKANSVTVFDLRTLKTLATIAGTGDNPDAIAYDPATHQVFTLNGKSRNATVIDAKQRRVTATIALPGKPEFAVTEGGHLYVNIEDTAQLVDIDIAKRTVSHTWALGNCESPSGLAIDKAHHRLFSVCENRMMTVVDSTSGRVVASVPIGDGPDAVAFDPAEGNIYTSNGGSGDISVVHEDDPDHYSAVATVPTQPGARTLALDPKLHRLYLSAATRDPASVAGKRPTWVPGSFTLLTVGKP
ncbi:DNA-binding beta-propeller fold protein YncE [Luteibacter rhizovicinus]|uniref:DNA-binding beta-propeller fold protein YncE n=1 Tax=Luteibacter rhizovicinus TaxID=242606 RepID=A0A4R3YFV5_9GAMM|nr:YncE family protein [Luteibacter rhizovicinus]TCV91455.1 DNA-binding beta-propeller fold protein YncE [Luteibacter rhizovicinus]